MRQDHPGRLRDLFRGNVLWLSIVSFLNDTASEIIYPLLPVFITTTLGAGAAYLGAIEGTAESASSLLKLAGGWVSDRARRRKPLVAWGYGIAVLVRPVLALATAGWHVLAIRVADRVGKGLRTAPRDALLTESVAPDVRGRAFGLHRAADHAGAVLGPLIATVWLLAFPGALRPLFAFTLVPGLLAVAIVAGKVSEAGLAAPSDPEPEPAPEPAPVPGNADVAAESSESAAATRGEVPGYAPGFHSYLAVLLLFTLGNASDAFLLLRARQLGVAVALIPLLWGAFHVSKMGWSVAGGVLADRIGPRFAILMGWAVYAAVYVAFGYAASQWHAWALFGVYGLFYGLTEAPEKALVATYSGPGRRGRAFGAYHFTIGLAALPASLVFGLLWQSVSPRAAFLYGGGLAVLAALLFLVFVPRPRQPTLAGATPKAA